MKGLSIAEPYPAMIAEGFKHYETRGRRTNYRGEVLIVATKNVWETPEYFVNHQFDIKPGKAYIVAELTDCIAITDEFIATLSDTEKAAGFYSVGRYAWKLENVRVVDEMPMRGYPAMWNIK